MFKFGGKFQIRNPTITSKGSKNMKKKIDAKKFLNCMQIIFLITHLHFLCTLLCNVAKLREIPDFLRLELLCRTIKSKRNKISKKNIDEKKFLNVFLIILLVTHL